MPSWAKELAQLASYLNERTPDRRPSFLEGAVPGGRSPVGALLPSQAGPPGVAGKAAAGQGGAGTATGMQPDLLGGTTGTDTGPGGPTGPGKKKSEQLTKQIARLGKRETRVEARGTRKEARLGKRLTRLEAKKQTPQREKKEARITGREQHVAEHVAAKVGKIETKIGKKRGKLFGS